MVALAGINTTTVAETIPTEGKSPLIIPPPTLMRIYEALAWQAPATGGTFDFPRWDAVTVTGSQTEADEFTAHDYATSKATATPAMVGDRGFVADQVALEGSSVTTEDGVARIAEAVRDRLDKDVLALFVTATNASDNTGVNLDLDLFDAALAAFFAQKPTFRRIAFVGSTNQIRDLRKAIRQSGNGGLIVGSGNEVFNGMPLNGFCGMWQGVEIWQGNTTEADASNDAGGFCACAPLGTSSPAGILPGSGLGLAVWGSGLFAEGVRVPSRRGYDATVSIYCGTARTAEHNARAFISKKAA